MASTQDADPTALAKVTADLVAAFSSIEEDQWARATPCTEWNLAALVDHVTGGNWFTVQILAGATSDQAMDAAMAHFDRGSATRQAAIQSAKDQLGAFEQVGVLDQSWHHVVGKLSGRQILRLRVHDLIIHAWDIGETLHPPASIPTMLAQWGLGELRDGDSLMAKHFELPDAPGSGAPTDDAGSAYLRAFGRRSI